ncbi:hypothetical protein GWI33_009613 [Rhynchophorus ferrugineus]|uniref:Uncharacterized protein n=1 Tax=Rhynchophorus ferrugineus TaxID=354439 RepID=A0A834MG04_RHYFE|nr:hypothetical protein GWI33_009613 [Rhynchophorus ferrugineus]
MLGDWNLACVDFRRLVRAVLQHGLRRLPAAARSLGVGRGATQGPHQRGQGEQGHHRGQDRPTIRRVRGAHVYSIQAREDVQVPQPRLRRQVAGGVRAGLAQERQAGGDPRAQVAVRRSARAHCHCDEREPLPVADWFRFVRLWDRHFPADEVLEEATGETDQVQGVQVEEGRQERVIASRANSDHPENNKLLKLRCFY